MIDPVTATIDELMELVAQKAANAGAAADKVEEARQLGTFLGLSMAKAVYMASTIGGTPGRGV